MTHPLNLKSQGGVEGCYLIVRWVDIHVDVRMGLIENKTNTTSHHIQLDIINYRVGQRESEHWVSPKSFIKTFSYSLA